MTPEHFIQKWKQSTLKERSASQSHFNDLCDLLDTPKPTDVDPDGSWFTFEKGAKKTGGGDGWADVWKQDCFGWEYKGKKKDLNVALRQLQQYAIALDNPPLLIVSDMDKIIIHTNFTNTISEIHTINIDDLIHADARNKLKAGFENPDILKPTVTRDAITDNAAKPFAELAQRLRDRGHTPERVAHFVTKLLFCMFAEDIGILKQNLFTDILIHAVNEPGKFEGMLKGLFSAMAKGGYYGYTQIPWFNGGLFNNDDIIPLNLNEINIVLDAAKLEWSDIEPAIFGTLFERGLDPSKRTQLGAHYTDRAAIMRLIQPVIEQPLFEEWAIAKAEILRILKKQKTTQSASAITKAQNKATNIYTQYIDRLKNFRVLDPACGSGNFLYLSLIALKNIEHRVGIESEALGLQRTFPSVSPQVVKGIEINTFAAELARVTIWIGEIQWMLNHGYGLNDNPVLKPLGNIMCHDALINPDGSEYDWPEADVIIGNPPFLGGSKMLKELGDDYTTKIRTLYSDRVPGGADLVAYWFAKASDILLQREVYIGFVSTQAIRNVKNRAVLESIVKQGQIYNVLSDEPWVNEGAAVRVSYVCSSSKNKDLEVLLDGKKTLSINSMLQSAGMDFTKVEKLPSNSGLCLSGTKKYGPFDISGDEARDLLLLPTNPNGKLNSDVIRRLVNGIDLTRRSRDKWVIDFGIDMSLEEACLYEKPFSIVEERVKPIRVKDRNKKTANQYWLFERPRPDLRKCLNKYKRILVTPVVSKHRIFCWLDTRNLPDVKIYSFDTDRDWFFGILHSKHHLLWSLKLGSRHGVGNDLTYNSRTCFDTFPFPAGFIGSLANEETSNPYASMIENAAIKLNDLRERWLNPPELAIRIPEVLPDYPERTIPLNDRAATDLKGRTLTKLYNTKPRWLLNAHEELDQAVSAAYGWDNSLSDDEILQGLLSLNQLRTKDFSS